MYEYACKGCGKPLEARSRHDARRFCSKKCYGQYLHNRKEVEYEPTGRRYVHPQGFDNLVSAICAQARHDYMKHSPGHWLRMDAERFFRSDCFAVLTELDGNAILRDLDKIYRAKRRKSNGHGKRSP